MNDLDDALQLRAVELADGIAQLFLLLEGQHVVVGDRPLRILLVRDAIAVCRFLSIRLGRSFRRRGDRRRLDVLLLMRLVRHHLFLLLEPGDRTVHGVHLGLHLPNHTYNAYMSIKAT